MEFDTISDELGIAIGEIPGPLVGLAQLADGEVRIVGSGVAQQKCQVLSQLAVSCPQQSRGAVVVHNAPYPCFLLAITTARSVWWCVTWAM